MSISLVKGQKVDLTKGNAGLSSILVGLGWDPAEAESKGMFGFKKKAANIDCDASALMLNADNKLPDPKHVICFYNLKSPCGSVRHTGDNLTGAGDGDDEQISIDLANIPSNIEKVLMVVNIYQCESRGQDFGMIRSAYIRVLNPANKQELIRFNLTDSYAGMTALVVGEVYRHNGEWKFNAIGEGAHAKHIDILSQKYL
ncbi:TerD family protein [Paenibacillus pini]|uniref:Tellurium resistance protein TerD n=1 Tax=Paenibacillus pini JCM 16418 TaxID=1236976 RepID=W7Z599_9BACL|nr:TerD family protein [Paenibacillus pini]GAF09504.1 tellurium resistance protein TerD [Paenibacillus pini JCM 16418]